MEIKLISWNVNGIRAVVKKGLWDQMRLMEADIYCFQETKAKAEQVPVTIDMPTDYFSYWNSAEKAGYSGVATYTKLKPREIINGMANKEFDREGRVVITKFEQFTVANVYFPNGKSGKDRLFYKMDFYNYFLEYINRLRKNGEKVIFCGDVNTAHNEIDLARPKDNMRVSGFLPEEREWMNKLEKEGWVDTFRHLHPEEQAYSWWDMKSGARARNVGWRIDYFYADQALLPQIKEAFILKEIEGSDHCPVGIKLDI